ncbi:hypothetical protein [Litchfieldia alkalitelluris]|uniref:hypothetical protein n=1 Tax=Litchfieldia alkalitelluris TaxID=304268 RepID=UPI000996CBAD|nr:hypothetical protein [Litchfieldia alkalitelluris]
MSNVKEILEIVGEAQKAVIEAQGVDDPERFQNAQYKLASAKQMLSEMNTQGMEESSLIEIRRAEELVRHLSEAHEANRAY